MLWCRRHVALRRWRRLTLRSRVRALDIAAAAHRHVAWHRWRQRMGELCQMMQVVSAFAAAAASHRFHLMWHAWREAAAACAQRRPRTATAVVRYMQNVLYEVGVKRSASGNASPRRAPARTCSICGEPGRRTAAFDALAWRAHRRARRRRTAARIEARVARHDRALAAAVAAWRAAATRHRAAALRRRRAASGERGLAAASAPSSCCPSRYRSRARERRTRCAWHRAAVRRLLRVNAHVVIAARVCVPRAPRSAPVAHARRPPPRDGLCGAARAHGNERPLPLAGKSSARPSAPVAPLHAARRHAPYPAAPAAERARALAAPPRAAALLAPSPRCTRRRARRRSLRAWRLAAAARAAVWRLVDGLSSRVLAAAAHRALGAWRRLAFL